MTEELIQHIYLRNDVAMTYVKAVLNSITEV